MPGEAGLTRLGLGRRFFDGGGVIAFEYVADTAAQDRAYENRHDAFLYECPVVDRQSSGNRVDSVR